MTQIDSYLRMNTQGEIVITGASGGADVTLSEYYRAKQDDRLGRWRWHDNDDYVVYPTRQDSGGPDALVFDESTGAYLKYDKGNDYASAADGPLAEAARAYFDEHPDQSS